MCRWAVYVGPAVALDAVLLKPSHSAIDMATMHYIPRILDSKSDLVDVYLHARRNHPINLDGFGVGWYPISLTPSSSSSACRRSATTEEEVTNAPPLLYKTVTPGAEDDHLLALARSVKSGCFFAHNRAGTVGRVSLQNCHPWAYGRFMWMHNGGIARFAQVRCSMIAEMGPKFEAQIQGDTDSETAFYLFLHFLAAEAQARARRGQAAEAMIPPAGEQQAFEKPKAFMDPETALRLRSTAAMLEAAMEKTVQFIVKTVHLVCTQEREEEDDHHSHSTNSLTEKQTENKRSKSFRPRDASSLNFVVTDGVNLVAIRFRDSRIEPPPSLFYAHGIIHPPTYKGGSLEFAQPEPEGDGRLRAAIVASEPLINFDDASHLQDDWHLVEHNHMVVIDERRDMRTRKLSIDCAALLEHKVRRWQRRCRAKIITDVYSFAIGGNDSSDKENSLSRAIAVWSSSSNVSSSSNREGHRSSGGCEGDGGKQGVTIPTMLGRMTTVDSSKLADLEAKEAALKLRPSCCHRLRRRAESIMMGMICINKEQQRGSNP